MKKILGTMIALILALTLSACGSVGSGSTPASDQSAGEGYEEGGYDAGGSYGEYDGAGGSNAGGYGNDTEYGYSGERYLAITQGGETAVGEEPAATLSLKVDTASYSIVKRYLSDGMLPPSDAVRTEELINYFSYDEDPVFRDGSPFGVYAEIGPSPFDGEKQMALIRVKTAPVGKEDLPPSNLVFLIDTSGSMNTPDKLPLLQRAFSMLTDTLDADDVVSIVTYANSSGTRASGVPGSEKRFLNDAIYSLEAGGSTAGARGIQTAYDLAEEYFLEGGNNRVILATDGDFNIGISDTGQLSDFIAQKRETGIYLSVLGFGAGNIRDDIMETLAKDGNGNYSYIDSSATAEKVLVKELDANLFTVADDVKAQIIFNPEVVSAYRLIGYENRLLAEEDFDDDQVDAGEIGAGADVVILFELSAVEDTGKFFDVNIRYKVPGETESKLLSVPVDDSGIRKSATTDYKFACAVAVFGDMLRHPDSDGGDAYGQRLTQLAKLAKANCGDDGEGYRADFLAVLRDLGDIV
jgi:Ca-activated chloride channel family protein